MDARTPQQRRERYLEAGRELLSDPTHEGPASLALSHVRLAHLAEQQGVRKGAVYHYWHSHDEFWRQLLVLLALDGQLTKGVQAATSPCRQSGAVPTPRDMWNLGDLMIDTINADRTLPVALATLAFGADDVSRPLLREAASTAVANIEGYLARCLPHVGLAIMPTCDSRRLATSLLSLLIGLSMQRRMASPGVDSVELQPGRTVSLFAAAASALILESCDVVGFTDELLDQLRSVRQEG